MIDREKRAQRRCRKRAFLFLLFIAGCFGIAAFGMTLSFRIQQNDALHALAREASFNNSQSQLQVNELQTQVVELSMNQGNETLLYNGTFIWGIGRGFGGFNPQPFQECTFEQTASAIILSSTGTGYRVGDLITANTVGANLLAAQFFLQPVLRVTQVDGLGAVLAFDTLFTGCLSPGVTTDTYQTISVVGSGAAVQISGGSVFLPSTYYDYPAPPPGLASPLQVSRYEVRSLQLESAVWTILHLFPPEFPMLISPPFPETTLNDIRISAYETYFNVPELVSSILFDSGNEITALTQHNYEALNFTDSSNCFVSSVCLQDALGPFGTIPRAVEIISAQRVIPLFGGLRVESYISFTIFSTDAMLNFVANGAAFNLNRPLMLVLRNV
jgi:hypothetical protein